MCTLIALVEVPGLPRRVLAANRDEFLARPTEPTAIFDAHGARMVGGRDALAGGSWLAFGARVTAALTNDRRRGIPFPGERSRGQLVTRAAAAPDARSARAALEAEPEGYGPFHLLAGDSSDLFYASNPAGRIETASVGPGVHVLGNFGLDDPADPVVDSIREDLDRFLAAPRALPEVLARLRAILTRHGPGWPCVHRGPYGTRYSALAVLDEAALHLEVSERAACHEGHRDQTALLRAVREAR